MDQLIIKADDNEIACFTGDHSRMLFSIAFGDIFSKAEVIELFLKLLEAEITKIAGGK